MNKEQIVKNIESIGRKLNGKAGLSVLIHTTLIAAMDHAKQHGDVTLVDRLAKRIDGTAISGHDLRRYVQAFSPIAWGGKDYVNVGLRAKDAKNYVAWNLAAAAATPFYAWQGNQRQAIPELDIDQFKDKLITFSAGLIKRLPEKDQAAAQVIWERVKATVTGQKAA